MNKEQSTQSAVSRTQSTKEDEMVEEKEAPRKVSRRQFVKGAAVGGAGVAAAGVLASCAPAAPPVATPAPAPTCPPAAECAPCPAPEAVVAEEPEAVKPIPPVDPPAGWDKETDVVVVGGGGSGLAAAVTAAEKGAKVIVLEKQSFCGGDTSIAMEFQGTGSEIQKRLGGAIPPIEEVVAGSLAWPYPTSGANPTMVRMIVERQGQTADWLEGMGVIYETGPAAGWPPSPPALGHHIPIDPEYPEEGYYRLFPHNGRGFTLALEKKATSMGIEILLETPAVALVTDAGTVVGVKAQDKEGNELYVKGKAIVLAAGGFGANKDMLEYYVVPRRFAGIAHYIGWPSNTGDGIRMAQGVGAEVDCMDEVEIWDGGVEDPKYPSGPMSFYNAANQVVRQKSLSVNKPGKRFFDESRYLGVIYSYQAAEKMSQKDQTSFTIFDADCIKREDIIAKFEPLVCEYPCPWFEEQFEEQLAEGIIMKADTIEGLAELMGVDPPTLRETVDTYNEYCDKGEDAEFFKPAKYLQPLRKPPFYAVKERGGSFFQTYGGLIVDEKSRVLDKEWNAIPGLYVAGENAAWFNTLGNVLPFGQITGESAAAEALGA